MSGYLHLLLLGLGAGSLYAMSALGLVLVYRSSGIVNFAHGAAGMVGAFALWDLTENAGWKTVPAAMAGVLIAAALGLATYLVTMVLPRRPSTLTRVVATLSVLIVVQAVGFLRYGTTPRQVSDFLPDSVVSFGRGVTVSADRLILLGITVSLTLLLGMAYQRSRFGVATSAVAERPEHLAALGWRVGRLRAINWAIGGALGGLAGVLLAPISGVSPNNALATIVPVLAAALLGGLSSFPLTLTGGLLIGVLQAEFSQHNFGVDGLPDAVPLLAIIVVLAVRGRVLPLRSFVGEKLPRVGNGDLNPALLASGTLGLVLVTALSSEDAATALTTSFLAAITVLSLTVVLGYAGQLSLAQVTLAGVGALIVAHLAGGLGLPFLLAVPLAALGTLPAGLLVGLPSLRARGVSLAIATLGLAIALQALVFRSERLAGGLTGVVISEDGSLHVLGMDFDSFLYPHRFAFLVLGFLVLLAVLVANLRRGRAGRRLVAVRANERAASALGVNVVGAKMAAFAIASAIAGVGGALTAYRNPSVTFEQFGIFGNIMAVAFSVVGGVGSAVGGILGGLLQDGGIGTWLLGLLGDRWSSYLSLIGGVSLLLSVAYYPDGVASALEPVQKLARRRPPGRDVVAPPVRAGVTPRRVSPAVLEIRSLDVRFGGVRAVSDVSLTLAPGEVVAIIGPNGAGKTTLIDAVSGFVPSRGTVVLGGQDLTDLPPHRRAAAGLARSWQSLELFEDLTVRENLRIACDPQDSLAYVVDLIRPHRGGLSPAALTAIEAFDLRDHLDVLPERLSTGQRKLVAMARAIASEPSVLLLDEPCSGLDGHERAEVTPLIRRLADDWGMGVLLVEHDVDLVRRVSDRAVALDFGAVIAVGEPDVVLADDRVGRAYLGSVVSAPGSSDDLSRR